MKKQFKLTSANKKPERQVEAVKFEIKKYIARERRKDLPEGSPFWEFKCRFGEDLESAEKIKISDINSHIDQVFTKGKEGFYLEISAKPAGSSKKS